MNMLPACTIEWNTLSLKEWESRFAQIPRANLLQSYAYARAACETNHQRARWGLIKIDGHEAGLVQILEAGLFANLFHAVILDRGPLWFDGFGNETHFAAFCMEFTRQFPRRWGRRRRFIPEQQNSDFVQKTLKNLKFSSISEQNYQTIWINLRENEQNLLKNTKKNWRSSLKRAQNSKIVVEWDKKGEYFNWLLQTYTADRTEKNYDGASLPLLKSLAKYFTSEENILIGRALIDNRPIAAVLILCHGAGATYQIGWSSDAGRRYCAHNLLLWDALGILKGRGITDFDLGGINDGTAKGVKTFKEGMGGQTICLPGIYR